MTNHEQDGDAGETGSNVLCACPAIGPEKDEHCRDLLSRERLPGTIIGVTVASSPGQRMGVWNNVATPRTTLKFVDVAHAGRSASMSTDGFGGQNGALVNVVKVEDMDLQRLGTEIVTQLREASQEPVVLCFDSLTDVLQFESEETVFRFLNALTTRVRETGVTAHYHLDADGHPVETIETLASLFDETIHVDQTVE